MSGFSRVVFSRGGHEKGGPLIRYVNAEDVLPGPLLDEIRRYFPRGALYIPSVEERAPWGERSGAKAALSERNRRIRGDFVRGATVESLALEYCLSPDSIRKIVKK